MHGGASSHQQFLWDGTGGQSSHAREQRDAKRVVTTQQQLTQFAVLFTSVACGNRAPTGMFNSLQGYPFLAVAR